MADKARVPAVAGAKFALSVVMLVASCAAPAATPTTPSRSDMPVRSSTSPLVVLHWMSFQHHAEPRYQLLLEGGVVGQFTELRLLGADGVPLAAASAAPSATATTRICSGSKAQPPTAYGALRVALSLASQQELGDVLRYPDRYRVEVLTDGRWQHTQLVHECDAQE